MNHSKGQDARSGSLKPLHQIERDLACLVRKQDDPGYAESAPSALSGFEASALPIAFGNQTISNAPHT